MFGRLLSKLLIQLYSMNLHKTTANILIGFLQKVQQDWVMFHLLTLVHPPFLQDVPILTSSPSSSRKRDAKKWTLTCSSNGWMVQVRTNPHWLRINIHSQHDRGQDAFAVSPFLSAAFSVSFSLARACFSESETLCCNLAMASSALGQKHGSFNSNGRNLPFH